MLSGRGSNPNPIWFSKAAAVFYIFNRFKIYFMRIITPVALHRSSVSNGVLPPRDPVEFTTFSGESCFTHLSPRYLDYDRAT